MTEKPTARRSTEPSDKARQSRSSAMIVLGLLMFVFVGLMSAMNPGGGNIVAPLILGILGVGLIVGGLVIRR